MTILAAALLFGLVIFIHELGHFLAAKFAGVKVLKFSIGFGPKLVGRTIGETEYVIAPIPLGGYVKMHGEDPDDETPEEALADPERSFKAQPLWKRALIVFSGPFFNILLTFALFTGLLAGGVEVPVPDVKNLMPVIDGVDPDYPAAAAGMRPGDRILSIGTTEINTWIDVVTVVSKNPEVPLKFVVQRGDARETVEVAPRAVKATDRDGKPVTIGRLGIRKQGQGIFSFIKSDSMLDAPVKGAYATWKMGTVIIDSVVMTVQGEISSKNIGGPIQIITESGKAASAGAISYFLFMALISVNLGMLNLLPIPVLDGGHLLFMAIESVTGRPLSDRTMIVAQRIGITLLATLMAFAMYNDLFRLFAR